MVLAPDLGEPTARFPLRPPFTVDSLFELPDDGLHYQVLDGELIVAPPAEPMHNLAADRIRTRAEAAAPLNVEIITNTAVRLPNGDGPVPDALVTTADPLDHPRGIPADLVHSVVEVVSPSNASDDRVKKTAIYANAGIPCYWRVELRPWREHLGPVPAIVVRLLGEDGDWHTTIYPAGEEALIPLAIGRGPELLPVKLDPAMLVGRRKA
jgi:Uma2 family endonuclease